MQCQFAQELFSDHISDTLDRAQKVSLENHLTTCRNCQEQIAGLRDVWATLETMPVVEPPKFFHENIMDRIAMEAAKEQETSQAVKAAGWNWRSLFRSRSLAFGGAVIVLFLAGFAAVGTQQGSFDWSHLFFGWFQKAAPVPLTLQKYEAVWNPDVNGGVLMITVRADALSGGSRNTVYIDIMQTGTPVPLKSNGVVNSDKDSTFTFPMATAPAPSAISLTVKDKETAPFQSKIQPLLIVGQ